MIFIRRMNGVFPVNWYEGMSLTALHLQQNDQHRDFIIKNIIGKWPYQWGFDKLELDPIKLSANIISIRGGAVIFPHGEAFFQLEKHNIKDFPVTSEKKMIYLAVKIHGDTTEIYDSQGFSVSDIHREENKQTVHKLVRKLFLLSEENMTGQHVGVPVVFIDTGGIRLNDIYPPCWRVRKNDLIYNKVSILCGSLRESLSFFVWYEKDRILGAELRQVLNIIIADLVELELLIESESHPFEVFKILSRIAGIISFLDNTPNKIFKYDHFFLFKCFQNIFEFLSQLLNTLHIRSTYVDLKQINNNTLQLDLQEKMIQKHQVQIIVLCNTIKQVQDVYNEIPDLQIFSPSMETIVTTRRIIGAERYLDNTMDQCFEKKAVTFTINLTSEYIIQGEALLIKGQTLTITKVCARL